MKTLLTLSTLLVVTTLTASVAQGQKGRGEEIGLSRQGAKPEMQNIAGTLERIETGPCERTTGRAYYGTHLFIRAEDETLYNLHLGSAEAMQPHVAKLVVGEPIEATAFRTDLLEENHYIAKSLQAGDVAVAVRSEDLSPFWKEQRRGPRRDQQLRGPTSRRERPRRGDERAIRDDRRRQRDGDRRREEYRRPEPIAVHRMPRGERINWEEQRLQPVGDRRSGEPQVDRNRDGRRERVQPATTDRRREAYRRHQRREEREAPRGERMIRREKQRLQPGR